MVHVAYSTLDSYVAVLVESVKQARRTEDSSRYRDHLAQAAVLYHLLRCEDIDGVRQLVLGERHSYGRAFLHGAEGPATEAAFSSFCRFADLISTL
jgi:hypothetical protein